MRNFIVVLTFVILVGCGTSNTVTNEDVASYEVKQTFDEQVEDEFIFRLVTGKEEYQEGEEVELYGEIIYTGAEEIIIAHAASAVIFNIEEQIRGFEVTHAVPEIGLQTTLVPDTSYREDYSKQGISYTEQESEDYTKFIEDFSSRNDFPPGYYTVEATTDFFDGTDHRKLKAAVDFKLWTGSEED